GAGSPWDLADGFTPNLPARVAYGFSWHGRTHAVELEFVHGRPAAVTVDAGARLALADAVCSGAVVAARIETRRRQARYHLDGAHVYLWTADERSEEHTSELQSRGHLVCRLLLEKKKMQLTKGKQRHLS